MTTTGTASAPSYLIRTLVDGSEQWPVETVTEPVNYELGTELSKVAADLAAEAYDNTDWHSPPTGLTVLIYEDRDELDPEYLAAPLAEGTFRRPA